MSEIEEEREARGVAGVLTVSVWQRRTAAADCWSKRDLSERKGGDIHKSAAEVRHHRDGN